MKVSSTILDLVGSVRLCHVLWLCQSSKGCSLPPVSASESSPGHGLLQGPASSPKRLFALKAFESHVETEVTPESTLYV